MMNNNEHNNTSVNISLIVCTQNRAHQLPPFLESLQALCCSEPWELLIVDNGSTDNTQEVLDRYLGELHNPAHISMIYEPQKGLARARNEGIRHSRGDIIAFTDDDCYPSPSFLDDVIYQFKTYPIAFLGGKVILFDRADLRITTKEDPTPQDFPPHTFLPTGVVHGANMAFAREPLLSNEGFDERLGAGTSLLSAEDIEMLARLSWQGYQGRYDPTPEVAHHHRIQDPKKLRALYKKYDHGRGAYHLLYILNHCSRSTYISVWMRELWTSLTRDWAVGRIMRELRGALHLLILYGNTRPQGHLNITNHKETNNHS